MSTTSRTLADITDGTSNTVLVSEVPFDCNSGRVSPWACVQHAGTGAYIWDAAGSQKGSRFVFKKNPDYWEAGKPYLNEIRQMAKDSGMKSLRVDGMEKVKAGITTLEEVFRATT